MIHTKKFFIPAIIFICCFLLYGNTIPNEYALDDGIYTNKNDFIIKGFSAFKDIFDKGSLYGFDRNTSTQYRPLALFNFMVETSIFGFNPHISHFFNVLLFALTVVLLFFFLQKILKNYDPLLIIATTLLFAFHPIHTEVVANIKSRDEILGFLFGLFSFYSILLYAEQHKTKYYYLSLTSFTAAIFCKENCLTFVAIIPLLLYFFNTMGIKKIIANTLPYLGMVCIYLFIRSLVLCNMTFTHQLPVMDNALISAGNKADMVATEFLLFGKYIYMTIIPYPLSWDYSYNQIPIVSFGNMKVIISLLVCVAFIIYAILGFKKRSIYSFLIAWFFITLLLSSNLIIKIASTFGERFLYVPSLAFCVALPVLASKIFKIKNRNKSLSSNLLALSSLGCLLLIYTIIIIPRNMDWKNNYTLFSSGVITSPNSAKAHLSLGQEYGDALKQAATKEEQQRLFNLDKQEMYRALSIYNKYDNALYDLGVLYFSGGMKDSAQLLFQKTLAMNPTHTAAANNLGIIYAQKSDYTEAEKYFNTALKGDSNSINALLNIGDIFQKTGNIDKAIYYYNRLLKMDSNEEDVKQNLFIIYYNYGKDAFNKSEYPLALQQFMLANKYNSRSAEVNGYLGALFQSKRDYKNAIEYYKKSLEINPNNQSVSRNLEEVDHLGTN